MHFNEALLGLHLRGTGEFVLIFADPLAAISGPHGAPPFCEIFLKYRCVYSVNEGGPRKTIVINGVINGLKDGFHCGYFTPTSVEL